MWYLSAMHRQCSVLLAPLLLLGLACSGEKGDSKACKELAAEFAAQETAQKATRDALSAAVKNVLASPPAMSEKDCNADGLDWQKYTHLTPQALERGHLGDPFYLGEFRAGSTCTKLNPENVKNKLETLRSKVASTANGHRLFFVDTARVEAKLVPDKKYSPGSVRGRLFVWSDAEKKFICTTEAFAQSGSKVYSSGSMKSEDLNKMLTRNAVGAGIETLKEIDPSGKAAPPTPEPNDGGAAPAP